MDVLIRVFNQSRWEIEWIGLNLSKTRQRTSVPGEWQRGQAGHAAGVTAKAGALVKPVSAPKQEATCTSEKCRRP